MTESLIVFTLKKGKFNNELYDSFLKYYDYGIGIGSDLSFEEVLKLYRLDYYSMVMFNQDTFKVSYYDSILFSRFRTNSDDINLENHIRMFEK